MSKITEFAPQGLATTAWAYSSLGVKDQTLLDAISKEVLRKLDEIEPQSLGILADAKLACRESIEQVLKPLADRFAQELPQSLDPAALARFLQFMIELRVDNFGCWGTRHILARMGMAEPPRDFHSRAAEQIRSSMGGTLSAADGGAISAVEGALTGAALVHRRVFSYAEYEVAVRGGQPLSGSMTKENGRRDRSGGGGASIERNGPLRPLSSPISGLVDRALCSEFQLMTAIVNALWQGVGERCGDLFQGQVQLFVSTAPCVSCLWGLRQFQLLMPRVSVEVANGEELYLFSIDKSSVVGAA